MARYLSLDGSYDGSTLEEHGETLPQGTSRLLFSDNMQANDSLAAYMGCEPDLLIFRRFLILHVRNLLLFQSQIIEKETQLIDAIEMDRESGNKERESFASMFSAMMNSKLEFDPSELSQKQISLELRPLLKDFGRHIF